MNPVLLIAFAAAALPALAGPFEAWDQDKDGRLSREELPAGPRQNFDRIDADRDGFISKTENEKFLQQRQRQPAQQAPQIPEGVELLSDLNYAGSDNPKQTLDLILPRQREGRLPVLVFIHGGAWMAGHKKQGLGNLLPWVRDGRYAGASVEYRFSQEATWPAQIHDCKAAIRWLRGNAEKYNLDPGRIAVWGSSAGGHLVAALGTMGDVKELEGTLGRFTNESSRVQAVVDFFGPADFPAISRITNSIRFGTAGSPESKLLGGTVAEKPEAARSASPVTFASSDDPPFLIAHGTRDNTVPFSQSESMEKALLEAKVATPPVFIHMVGGGHGFRSDELNQRIAQFFELHLYGRKSDISSAPIETAGR